MDQIKRRLRAAFFVPAAFAGMLALSACVENPVPGIVNPVIPATGPAQEAARVTVIFSMIDKVLGADGNFAKGSLSQIDALKAERLACRHDAATDLPLYGAAALSGARYLVAYAEKWGLTYTEGDLTAVLIDALRRAVADVAMTASARVMVAAAPVTSCQENANGKP